MSAYATITYDEYENNIFEITAILANKLTYDSNNYLQLNQSCYLFKK